MKMLTQAAFQLQVTNDANTYNLEKTIDFLMYDSYPDEIRRFYVFFFLIEVGHRVVKNQTTFWFNDS